MGISVIFLCAGYGTRLERDILNAPAGDPAKRLLGLAKAMLPIGGQPLISHWIDLIAKEEEFDHFYIVTNSRFYSQFEDLAKNHGSRMSIFNDNTTSNDDRMGAVAGIEFGIENFSLEKSDVLVIGGDTLLLGDFSIGDFVTEFKKLSTGTASICGLLTAYTCKEDETTKYGILEVEEGSKRIRCFIEKPQPHETKSRLACPCFYLLSSGCTDLIKRFLQEKRDAPLREKDDTGQLIKYLVANCDVFAYEISGRFDVGGLQSYKECNDYFKKQ